MHVPVCALLQDKYHLYFLFDLMPGGDLMDVLVAEAKVIKRRVPQGGWQVGSGLEHTVIQSHLGRHTMTQSHSGSHTVAPGASKTAACVHSPNIVLKCACLCSS